MESESGCEEVLDHGQEDMSLRWVIKEKAFDNEKLVQPRLCSNMFYRRIASIFQYFYQWALNLLDVKISILQSKRMECTVFVRPNRKIWKLQKCIYGLIDASRFWYLKLKGEFIRLGVMPSILDNEISVWTKEQIVFGIFTCFCR